MHELHLAQDVLEKIKAEAAARGLARVKYARVRIGEARVSDLPELRQILSDISKGTLAQGLELELEISPLRGECAACGSGFDPKAPRLDCPACGSTRIEVISGKELLIEDLK